MIRWPTNGVGRRLRGQEPGASRLGHIAGASIALAIVAFFNFDTDLVTFWT